MYNKYILLLRSTKYYKYFAIHQVLTTEMCLVVKSHSCHTCRLKISVAIFKSSLLLVADLRGRAVCCSLEHDILLF